MGRTTGSEIQSFSSPDSMTFIASSPLQNVHRARPISAIHLSKVLDAAMDAKKISKKLAMHTICPSTAEERNSFCNFIKCYLDSTVLLLDAFNNMQLRIENILGFLSSIPIGQHCLVGEQEQIRNALRRAAGALESGCLRDKRHTIKTEKFLSLMRTSGEKLNMAYRGTNGSISPELNKALSASWKASVLAVVELSSATCFKSRSTNLQLPPNMVEHNQEPWTVKRDELNEKINVFRKKTDERVSMEELNAANIAAETLLKLISLQKGSGRIIRRIAIKTMVEEFQRRKDQLGKTLPQIEDKIRELYMLISGLRMSMLELLSEAQKEEDTNPAKRRVARNLIQVQKKLTKRTSSLAKLGSRLQFIKKERGKPISI
ncbi:hypothetical protein KSP39_PZI006114 [Platanthera zijinensis]|uniref:Uncharacterized protein n=1 Tax=Platanthera zijinensis TaxID=2320716 RepID=A0AAP0BTR0_9ASPA